MSAVSRPETKTIN